MVGVRVGQEGMDQKLKEQTDEVEGKIRALQLEIDEQEDAKTVLERKREDLQAATQVPCVPTPSFADPTLLMVSRTLPC